MDLKKHIPFASQPDFPIKVRNTLMAVMGVGALGVCIAIEAGPPIVGNCVGIAEGLAVLACTGAGLKYLINLNTAENERVRLARQNNPDLVEAYEEPKERMKREREEKKLEAEIRNQRKKDQKRNRNDAHDAAQAEMLKAKQQIKQAIAAAITNNPELQRLEEVITSPDSTLKEAARATFEYYALKNEIGQHVKAEHRKGKVD